MISRQPGSLRTNRPDRTDQLQVRWAPEPNSTNRPRRKSSSRAHTKSTKSCPHRDAQGHLPAALPATGEGEKNSAYVLVATLGMPHRCPERAVLDLSSPHFLARCGGTTIRPKLWRVHHIAHPDSTLAPRPPHPQTEPQHTGQLPPTGPQPKIKVSHALGPPQPTPLTHPLPPTPK